jgi:FKBP-type peptidyl-prolyl cis-trans isomerase (trigger factor)
MREFHKQISDEVHGRLIRSLYQKAIDQEKVKMVALLDIGDVLFSPETGITFTVTLDVQPEFDLPKYKKIPVSFEEAAARTSRSRSILTACAKRSPSSRRRSRRVLRRGRLGLY